MFESRNCDLNGLSGLNSQLFRTSIVYEYGKITGTAVKSPKNTNADGTHAMVGARPALRKIDSFERGRGRVRGRGCERGRCSLSAAIRVGSYCDLLRYRVSQDSSGSALLTHNQEQEHRSGRKQPHEGCRDHEPAGIQNLKLFAGLRCKVRPGEYHTGCGCHYTSSCDEWELLMSKNGHWTSPLLPQADEMISTTDAGRVA